MGRKQFRQDLAAVSTKPPPGISDILQTDDGELSFRYHYTTDTLQKSVELKLLATDVDEYPTGNQYMIFTNDNYAEPSVLEAFEVLSSLMNGESILGALEEVSAGLYQALKKRNEVRNPLANKSDCDNEVEMGNGFHDSEEEEDWSLDASDDNEEIFGFQRFNLPKSARLGVKKTATIADSDLKKVRSDLRVTKAAGFRIGVFGDLSTAGIICVSVRVAKLGISEEVMKAWNVESCQYFMLLLRFQRGYRTAEQIREEGILQGDTELRLGLCTTYKPSVQAAFDAFNQLKPAEDVHSQQASNFVAGQIQPLFIGQPLNTLLKDRFSTIIKLRETYMLTWCGAELLFNDSQGCGVGEIDLAKYDIDDNDHHRLLPDIVTMDSMSGRLLKDCTLPLLAMQFSLRHFVRCTEFCLVCHCRVEESLEALKPYVCSRPLCLYQYMALGFGPSIEWEILSQPYVVDLLICFCYSQALAGRLRDFPTGINLRVPFLPQYTQDGNILGKFSYKHTTPSTTKKPKAHAKGFFVKYNARNKELLFEANNEDDGRKLQKGAFIALIKDDLTVEINYHRIEDIIYPSIKLGPPITVRKVGTSLSSGETQSTAWSNSKCYTFDTDFDELSQEHKQHVIIEMLETLPAIREMRKWLEKSRSNPDVTLRQWRERIITPALDVLRWVIASNRSCIMQVDTVVQDDVDAQLQQNEDRVSGMDEYMQFRFAQGAPDKEQRFINAIESNSSSKPQPTIFAWHGSPLYNWHSIIREGLHFNDTLHGRAYGNGVYMSNNASTSLGYISMGYSSNTGTSWSNSELKVTGAISLNEVVNKPESFVSKFPHYVVAETDWIQTRYLFVRTTANHSKAVASVKEVVQDPNHPALGYNHMAIRIPITAIPKSRRLLNLSVKQDSKKRKSGDLEDNHDTLQDDGESVTSIEEDLKYMREDIPRDDNDIYDEQHSSDDDIFMSDTIFDSGVEDENLPRKKPRQENNGGALKLSNGCLVDMSKTNFEPGRLDMSNIKRLPPPDDASRAATNALMKAFKALLTTQATTPAHNLGWYINPDLENMYQWIVELHSFDKEIQLAKDMKAAGFSSIVIEMRFTNQYPFAPPFVRVIKPRFVPFNQGGGGHVTEGGAICMELLTNNGWSAVSSIESVLLQVRLAMSEKERPARLPAGRSPGGVYGVGEAMTAYERACRAHGWKVPEAFSNLIRSDENKSRY